MTATSPSTRSFGTAYAILALGGAVSWASTYAFGSGTSGLKFASVLAPGAILLAAALALIALARGEIGNLVSPTGIIAVVVGGFFGLGALVPVLANQDLIAVMQEDFPYTIQELVAAHRVTAVGVFALAAAAWLLLRRIPARPFDVGRSVDVGYLKRSATRLLIVGTGVRLLVTTPYVFGSRAQLLPGIVGSLDMLAHLGILVLAYGVFRGLIRERRYVLMLTLFSAGNIVLGLITLMKLALFLPVLAVMGGAILAKPSVRRTVILAGMLVVSYSIVQPIVSLGRMVVVRTSGSVGDSFDAVSTSASLLSDFEESETVKGMALARFSYTTPTVLAMREYDGGRSGTSMTGKLLWTFVPRVVWPQKPSMTETGREVSIMLNGNDENTVGLGIFAEGYWNGGFLGVVLGSIFVGLLMGSIERTRWRALESFDVAWLFVLWQGAYMAEELSAYFLPAYVGFWPIIAAIFVFLRILIGSAPATTTIQTTAEGLVETSKLAPGIA